MRMMSVSAPVSVLSVPVFVLSVLVTLPQARASFAADPAPDSAALVQLEQRAQQADPRERCFLYTELAHFYTAVAGRQIAQGEMEQVSATLKRIEHYAEMIHAGLISDAKKVKNLKNAEMLLHETSYHLHEYVHMVSSEDKDAVQATLKHLDKVNDEMLTQVFAH